MMFTDSFFAALVWLAASAPANAGSGKPSATGNAAAGGGAVAIDVDTTALGEFGDVLHTRLDYELGKLLEQRKTRNDPKAVRRLRIAVQPSNKRNSGYLYVIESTRGADAGTKATARESGKCEPCTDELALTDIMKLVPEQLDGLDGEARSAPSSPDPVPPPVVEPTSATVGPADGDPNGDGKTRGLSPLTKAGVGIVGAGLAIAVGGAVMLAVEPKTQLAPGDPSRSRARNLRDPGIGVLVVGGAVAVTGAVLAIIGAKRSKRRTAMAPMGGRASFGVALTGRF
jgi:hypothetical protein